MSTAKWLRKVTGRPVTQSSQLLRQAWQLAGVEEDEYPDKVDLDWDNLKFAYQPTDSYRVHTWTEKTGWGPGVTVEEETISLPPLCSALHYGQQAYEGLKAYETQDGDINIFQPENANAHRFNDSCYRMCMPEISTELFNDAIISAVQDNRRWVPPYGKGSLYIRPFIIGTSPQLGLAPSSEYKFAVCVMPVGTYYAGGTDGLNALVMSDFDRAASRGTGGVKVGGNYGADLLPGAICQARGFDTTLYVDSSTQSYIEEFSVANFAGITKCGTYVTPKSDSVLPSVTNNSLMQLARDSGMDVQKRAVPLAELSDLKEVAAIGTAVVVNPIGSITAGDTCTNFDAPKTLLALKENLISIQTGDAPDVHSWLLNVPE